MTDYSQIEKRYWEYVEHIAEQIVEELRKDKAGSLDGREWCEENNVMETTFADAVCLKIKNAEYGISPMYPFRSSNVEVKDER